MCLPYGYSTFCNWSCFPRFYSWGISDLSWFRNFVHRFPCVSILSGFILFFYPRFPFALSLCLFLSHFVLCTFWWTTSNPFFGTQRSINKSINTSYVCKYGTLFFLEQFLHPLALWVLSSVRKVGQAQSPHFADKEAEVHPWMKYLAEEDTPLHLYIPNEPLWRRRQT